MTKRLYTIGHGIRSINSFIKTLIENKVKCLVDVRSYPGSRYVPQFNQRRLATSLHKYHIKYIHLSELGGRRRYPNFHHPSITVAAFASYAEYMMTKDFKIGLAKLKKVARKCRTAIMCAETLYWQCHRRMISDRLEYDKWKVFHLGITKAPIRHTIWNISRRNQSNQIIYDR